MTDWLLLEEHERREVSPSQLTQLDADQLFERYGTGDAVLDIEWPSPKTRGQYVVSAKGAVGALPLPTGGGVRIAPKVPLDNLFRMLETAYDIRIRDFDEHVSVASVDDLFDRLAHRLATAVLRRVQRGLIKEYHQFSDRLPYVRGRLDVGRLASAMDRSQVDCDFDEHTADVHDNQVLVWTLHRFVRSPVLTHRTRSHVQRALYGVGPAASVKPIASIHAVRRFYDRLRMDYRPMHLLCRFLLENAGPTHFDGDRETTAFVVQMPRLFERYVAADLVTRLPGHLRLDAHERINLSTEHALHFDVDLVLRDRTSGKALMVLDTKYKAHDRPSTDDVSQVASYALAVGCNDAALVYPSSGKFTLTPLGHVVVRRLGWPLTGDLDDQGDRFAELVTQLSGKGDDLIGQS